MPLDAEGAAAALSEGADVNAKDSLGLPYRPTCGILTCYESFLGAGVNLESTDEKGQTPLLWATGIVGMAGIQPDVPFSEPPAAGDNAEVVRLLVEAGANVRVVPKH